MSKLPILTLAVLSCAMSPALAAPTPTFTDPTALVTWLIKNSGHGFTAIDDTANAPVLTPGLRAALRTTFARSRRRNEPPCGADGDIILDTQEPGTVENLQLSAQTTAPDRQTVSASFDIVGYHRTPKFQTVRLQGVWKLENIVSGEGSTLRRALDCRN